MIVQKQICAQLIRTEVGFLPTEEKEWATQQKINQSNFVVKRMVLNGLQIRYHLRY